MLVTMMVLKVMKIGEKNLLLSSLIVVVYFKSMTRFLLHSTFQISLLHIFIYFTKVENGAKTCVLQKAISEVLSYCTIATYNKEGSLVFEKFILFFANEFC